MLELASLSAVRLLSLTVPPDWARHHPGPQFGVSGTRALMGLSPARPTGPGPVSAPMIGTIVKPSVGLTPDATAAMVDDLGRTGLSFVKDDELMEDPVHSQFENRVDAVLAAIARVHDETGHRVMYAPNVSGDVDQMRARHDHVVNRGGTAVMVNINQVGIAGVRALRQHATLPIHGHRAGWGMLSRSDHLGMAFGPYQTLWRLAGVDHLHVGGMAGKFSEDEATVAESLRDCLTSLAPTHGPIVPVVSSAQWAGTVAATVAAAGGDDFLFLAGGGILGHPAGPAAGVRSHAAFAAVAAGESLTQVAARDADVRGALETFGGARR